MSPVGIPKSTNAGEKAALAIRHIGELLRVPRGPVVGRAMGRVETLSNAALLVAEGRIAWFGADGDVSLPPGCTVLDAEGGCVLPGLIDCHTHTVFAGTREHEFVMKIEGKSYAQIAEAGGGIRVTVDAVRRASLEELVALARPRLERMARNGVTTVEIKSGYGLTVEDELKMLRAVRRLAETLPVELVGTYLAAHTTPREFANRPDEYLDQVFAESVLTRLRDEKLAEFCDVFCEQTAFDVARSRRVLEAGKRFGLRPKLHADQITQMGATVLAGEVGAISADHLEHIDDAGMNAMKRAGTVAVLLPACSFFLGVPQAPARKLLGADLPVAVATDFNPGSSMVESLPLAMSIACMQMRMTPTQVVVAATANAAAALGRADRLGAIEIGMQADLVVLDVPNHVRWLYEPGRNSVRHVIKQGRQVI
ncbi:MAG: imidazolonepropionase [Phycisphaerales bacterium]|nr:imidazolonepropionase [Phycisphaerales bacterium]